MATRDETRIPLLLNTDENGVSESLEPLVDNFEVEYALRTPPREVTSQPDSRSRAVSDNAGGTRQRRKHYSGNEMIVAVFVVAFDTKKGNLVEWRYPTEVFLEGVEFKSMASGLHNVTKDFIYFKQNQLFGLSCYEKFPVANQEERGARMKSVGLLAVGYDDLHLHMEFLQRQVRILVETPGEYGSLEEYFRHYQSPQQVPRPSSELAPVVQETTDITHPSGCFTQFLRFFGPSIFVLWKLALLKKRIILFSPPPIGVVCHRVYCTCLLATHVLTQDLDTDCNPQFYVNVADIEQLSSLDSYVACTTEKIFQSKTHLYDVFVDSQNIVSHLESLTSLLKPTLADEQRYEHLNNIRSNQMISSGESEKNDELGFADFFKELNSQMFRTMMDAASCEDHILTLEMVESFDLDPIKDRYFLTELANVYGLNMIVQRSHDMFTCCL